MNDFLAKLKAEKNMVIVTVVVILLSFAAGRYFTPTKVQIQTKEVIKTVEVEKKNVDTEKHEIDRPDGTKEITEITHEKTDTTTKTDDNKSSTETVTYSKPGYHAYLTVGAGKLSDLTNPIYGVGVEKRVIGPVFVGGSYNTNREIGLSVGLEF